MTLLRRLRGGLSRTAPQLGQRVDDLLGSGAGVGDAKTRDFTDPPHDEQTPFRVVLVVCVNGTGKISTVAKLAHLLNWDGGRPLVCSADTFRAAGVEQLSLLAEIAHTLTLLGRNQGPILHRWC